MFAPNSLILEKEEEECNCSMDTIFIGVSVKMCTCAIAQGLPQCHLGPCGAASFGSIMLLATCNVL